MQEAPQQYVSSFINRKFICPICKVDLEDKKMFLLHMAAQHPKEYNELDMDNVDQLEAWKNGDTDVLNL